MSDLTALITRAETLLQRIETILPQPLQAPDWQASTAYRYRRSNGLLARLKPTEILDYPLPGRIRDV